MFYFTYMIIDFMIFYHTIRQVPGKEKSPHIIVYMTRHDVIRLVITGAVHVEIMSCV